MLLDGCKEGLKLMKHRSKQFESSSLDCSLTDWVLSADQGYLVGGCLCPFNGNRDRRRCDDQDHQQKQRSTNQEVSSLHHIPGQPANCQYSGTFYLTSLPCILCTLRSCACGIQVTHKSTLKSCSLTPFLPRDVTKSLKH